MKKLLEKRYEVGLTFVAVGVPMGMYLSYFFHGIKGSTMLMVLSVLLVINWKSFQWIKLSVIPPILRWVIAFQVIMLLYAALTDLTAESAQYIIFQFYVIAISLILGSQNKTLPLSTLPETMAVILSPFTLIGTWLTSHGFIGGEEWYAESQAGNAILEQFTASLGFLVNYIAVLTMSKKTLFRKIVFVLTAILCFYSVLTIGKRTPLFVMLIATLFYFYSAGKLAAKHRCHIVLYAAVITATTVLFYFANESFRTKVDAFAYNFYSGVFNLFGDYSIRDTTGSAGARAYWRAWASDYIAHHFNLFNYVFGSGYMTKWLDCPIYQAYLDMGIVGFCLYAYTVVVYPLSIALKRIANPNVQLATMLCFYAILSILNSGHPYMYIKFTPIVILAVIYQQYQQSVESKKKAQALPSRWIIGSNPKYLIR